MKSQICIVLALAAVCLAQSEETKTHDKRQVLAAPALLNTYVAPRLPYAALPYNTAYPYAGFNAGYNGLNAGFNGFNAGYAGFNAGYPFAGLPYNAVPYAGYPFGVGRVGNNGVAVAPAAASFTTLG